MRLAPVLLTASCLTVGPLDGGPALDPCADRVICLDAVDGPQAEVVGPRLFRVAVDEAAFVAVEVIGVEAPVSLAADPFPSALLDEGEAMAATWAEPGELWVQVEAPAEARWTLRVNQTAPGDLEALGVAPAVAHDALRAFATAWDEGETDALLYTVIDLTRPSTDKRLWTVDLADGALLHHLEVAHGRGSAHPRDLRMAASVSNASGSNQSSVGLARTAETYVGRNGYSLRLDGLEPGFNDRMRDRAVVVHGAAYARPEFVAEHGYLGRSFGCPAVDDAVARELIDRIAGGTLVLTWFEDPDWQERSAFL